MFIDAFKCLVRFPIVGFPAYPFATGICCAERLVLVFNKSVNVWDVRNCLRKFLIAFYA